MVFDPKKKEEKTDLKQPIRRPERPSDGLGVWEALRSNKLKVQLQAVRFRFFEVLSLLLSCVS